MTRAKKVLVAGAFVAAALAGPVVAALGHSATPQVSATGKCLAWFGSRDDGQCMGYSNGSGTTIGTPAFGVNGQGNGLGMSTGPLMPGQTFNQGITP